MLGGTGGSIAMLAYNDWLREERMTGPAWVRFVRADIAIAYGFTALFGMSVMIVANQAFHAAGIPITNAQAVTKMAETLGAVIGPIGFYAYAIGFWSAVFASLLGIWQSIAYLFADDYGLMARYPRARREALVSVTSTPYRLALLFITIVPIGFVSRSAAVTSALRPRSLLWKVHRQKARTVWIIGVQPVIPAVYGVKAPL